VHTTARFIEARDVLLRSREDWASARRDFRWPIFSDFNWVRDYFDVIATASDAPALRVVSDSGYDESLSFGDLARRSSRVAGFLVAHGVEQGDRILVMLPSCVALWETMLAAIRLGAVVIPATTLLDRRNGELRRLPDQPRRPYEF
jgi:acetyl-CoA synthetase